MAHIPQSQVFNYQAFVFNLAKVSLLLGIIYFIDFYLSKLSSGVQTTSDQSLVKKKADIQPSSLLQAVEKGDLKNVQYLIEQGRDVNKGTWLHLNTALHIAVRNQNVEIVRALLEKGANVNLTNKDGDTALHIAVRKCNTSTMSLLLEKGANVDLTNKDGDTALHIAVRKCDISTMSLLLEKGANVDLTNKDGDTAIDILLDPHNDTEIQRKLLMLYLLIGRKARLSICNLMSLSTLSPPQNFSKPPLDNELEYAFCEFYLKLSEEDQKFFYQQVRDNQINAKNKHGDALLHTAVKSNNIKAVQLLLKLKDIDANLTANSGYTALHIAALKGHMAIVQYLIEKGANIHLKTNSGNTALHYAAENGHMAIVQYLIEKGAEVNLQNKDGGTALHYAAENGHMAIVKCLIENGAEVNLQTEDNQTAIDILLSQEELNQPILCHLISSGAYLSINNIISLNQFVSSHQLNIETVKLTIGQKAFHDFYNKQNEEDKKLFSNQKVLQDYKCDDLLKLFAQDPQNNLLTAMLCLKHIEKTIVRQTIPKVIVNQCIIKSYLMRDFDKEKYLLKWANDNETKSLSQYFNEFLKKEKSQSENYQK